MNKAESKAERADLKRLEKLLRGYTFEIDIRTRCYNPLQASDDPQDAFVSEINGRVTYGQSDTTERVVVGELCGHLVHWGEAVNQREPIYDLVDIHSQTLASAYAVVADSEDNIREEINGGRCPAFLVHIDRLMIEAAHRGRGLGLCLLWKLTSMFTDSVFVMEPFPLQHGALSAKLHPRSTEAIKRWGVEALPKVTAAEGRRRLQRYYARVGFTPVRSAPKWMVLASDRDSDPNLARVLRDIGRSLKSRSSKKPYVPRGGPLSPSPACY